MVARVGTVAFLGIEVADVDVQVQVTTGLPAFQIVGLADKAVGESRERVRSALGALGLSLPPKRITVNLAPADQIKEGSHFDLPIALGLLVAMGVVPAEEVAQYVALGELGLDGRVAGVAGALPAAVHALSRDKGLICPEPQGPEAAWAEGLEILAPNSLIALVNHFKGTQLLQAPRPQVADDAPAAPDLGDIKGQESVKRALEVAAAGAHNMAMTGPPGAGKSMLAARMPGLLPPLDPAEALEVSMIHSVAGTLTDGKLVRHRPYRDPHHSASLPALTGGGQKARPGEVSLAHLGVLFLDELPEFSRQALEALRQPLETGRVAIARANAHVAYPSRFQLVAAMNPCKCGYLDDPELACARAPRCASQYQAKISGPLIDRIDIHVDVPNVSAADLTLPPPREGSAEVAERVAAARRIQAERYAAEAEDNGDANGGSRRPRTNAEADGSVLERVAQPDEPGRQLLAEAAERLKLSARGYHRVLRVARTLADLEGTEAVGRVHVAEALSYRRVGFRTA